MERSNKDYAIEFGDYLANSAEQFMQFLNESGATKNAPDASGMTDHWRALNGAIYEFRKRAAKARAHS